MRTRRSAAAHKLGKDEALRRIKPALGKASENFPVLTMAANLNDADAPTRSNRDKNPDEWVTGDETMTGAGVVSKHFARKREKNLIPNFPSAGFQTY